MSSVAAQLASYRTHHVGRKAACACLCHSDGGRPLIPHSLVTVFQLSNVWGSSYAGDRSRSAASVRCGTCKQLKMSRARLAMAFREQTRQETNLHVSNATQISCLQFSTGLEVLWAGEPYICTSMHIGHKVIQQCLMQVLQQEACIPCNAKLPCSVTHVCMHMRVGCMTCVAWGTVYCPCVVTAGVVTQLGGSPS